DLVLATGVGAALPPLEGLRAPDGGPGEGVTALRDLADCRRLRALVRPGAPVVVLGGGVLGLETARALAAAGTRVSVVESSPWIMRRQIDRAAAEVLAGAYTALGVAVHSWRVAARWTPGTGLELDDGRVLPGDAVVVTPGVRPATAPAQAAGLAVEAGALVDGRAAPGHPGTPALRAGRGRRAGGGGRGARRRPAVHQRPAHPRHRRLRPPPRRRRRPGPARLRAGRRPGRPAHRRRPGRPLHRRAAAHPAQGRR